MKQTIRIKLEGDLYQDWAAVIRCCGKTKHFNSDDMTPGVMWNCIDCNKLLLVIDEYGIPYYVGDPVFDRKRE